MTDRKELLRAYKEAPPPAGVVIVRNTHTGRTLVLAAPNLAGMLNRQRFQLEMGGHLDKELQRDWNELGADAFAIEELDRLEQPAEGLAPAQLQEDLAQLAALWAERLEAEGTTLYPLSRRRN